MSMAAIRWISGPVLRARTQGSFFLRECVRVGPQALLGEVVRIDDDESTVQVYEDTTGPRPATRTIARLRVRAGTSCACSWRSAWRSPSWAGWSPWCAAFRPPTFRLM